MATRGRLGDVFGELAAAAARRVGQGALDGVKGEFAPDGAAAALAALDKCLEAASPAKRREILAAVAVVVERHGGA